MNSRRLLAFGLAASLGLVTLLSSLTPSSKPIGLDALKGFVGTWVQADENGKPTDVIMSIVRPTAAGSVLMETMFPGTDHEMITMYYTREGHLMLTHYCGCTNHPILKASYDVDGGLRFSCIGTGENFAVCAKTTHMHEAVYHFSGDNFQSSWGMWDDGKMGEHIDFNLVRAPAPVVKKAAETK